MSDDRTSFEARLAEVFDRYADGAPVDVDPWVVAQAAARSAATGRRPSIGWLRALRPEDRGWIKFALTLSILGLLLVALTLAWVGSQRHDPAPWLNQRQPSPDATASRAPAALVTPTAIDGLSYTGTTAPARPLKAGPVVQPAYGPRSVDTAAGKVHWTGYQARNQGFLYEGPDGGYILTGSFSIVGAPTWYSSDGRSWEDWSALSSLYSSYPLVWAQGDWASTTALTESDAGSSDHLWHLEGRTFREVEPPTPETGFGRPSVSGDMQLLVGTAPDVAHDWIILVDGQGQVHQYPSPWSIPEWVRGGDGVGHSVHIAPLESGGYVAVAANTASYGQGPPEIQYPGEGLDALVPPMETWTTFDGLSWLPEGPAPFFADGPSAIRTTRGSIFAWTFPGGWEFGADRAWVRVRRPILPTGGDAVVVDGPIDFSSSAAIAGGQMATYGVLGTFTPLTTKFPDGPYWYRQDGTAGWSLVPGPPWVSESGYLSMAGYEVTPQFLAATFGEEAWIGITEGP